MIYVPQSQVPKGMTAIDVRVLPITWVVRTAAEPYSLSNDIQRELRVASGGLAVGRVRSMDDVVKQSTARSDSNTVLFRRFCRHRSIARGSGHLWIDFVFGWTANARTWNSRRSWGHSRSIAKDGRQTRFRINGDRCFPWGNRKRRACQLHMKTLLFGVKPVDPVTMCCACVLLGLVAVLAAFIPARRAARLEPVEVLRSM